MFKKPWIFTSNPFNTATEGSYVAGLQLSTYLDAALNAAKADAAILLLYNYYHPIHVAYVGAYTVWNVQGGTQIGQTQTLVQLLDGLTAKVNAWEYTIMGTFPKGTPTFNALFPHGHGAFTRGTQTNRIAAVTALDNALTPYAALASTKTDVHNYFTQLDAANNTQKGTKTVKNTNSDQVEAQRILMANGQMYVYGGLVQKFVTQLDRVGDFFDLQLIRNGKQTQFAGHTNADSIGNVFKRTLAPGTQIKLTNTGNVEIRFYLATNPGDAGIAPIVMVSAHQNTMVDINQLGDPLTQHYLNTFNQDPSQTATWEVEIM